MVEISMAGDADVPACIDIAESTVGARRAGPIVQAAFDRGGLLVAHANGQVVGLLVYRTDWFACTLVVLVSVRPEWRRRGVARALYRALEDQSASPRIFSSTEETNTAGLRMHRALGFVSSGHVDNLPHGYREIFFFKRIRP